MSEWLRRFAGAFIEKTAETEAPATDEPAESTNPPMEAESPNLPHTPLAHVVAADDYPDLPPSLDRCRSVQVAPVSTPTVHGD
jgi:hypothetical protein